MGQFSSKYQTVPLKLIPFEERMPYPPAGCIMKDPSNSFLGRQRVRFITDFNLKTREFFDLRNASLAASHLWVTSHSTTRLLFVEPA